jgi:hypothetical protein
MVAHIYATSYRKAKLDEEYPFDTLQTYYMKEATTMVGILPAQETHQCAVRGDILDAILLEDLAMLISVHACHKMKDIWLRKAVSGNAAGGCGTRSIMLWQAICRPSRPC